jgi:nicotinate phosphoribosyltransferase
VTIDVQHDFLADGALVDEGARDEAEMTAWCSASSRGVRMDASFSEALLTDLYHLTMLQAYFHYRMRESAVFELFVRKLPANRNFLVAAGLEQVIEFLERFRFGDDELQYLRSLRCFGSAFLEWLGRLRFTGDVDAMPEGTIFFPDEPVLRVRAPIPEAQVVETRLINIVHFQTVVASKAARIVLSADGHQLIDFGLRRAHAGEAGLWAARACYLAGMDGTATVEAGRRFGIPVSGTMAHSFVQAHNDETEAFLRFARANPDNVVLLIDTYDTERAAQRVVELEPLLRQEKIVIRGVRLDSGDLGEHARRVRAILDEGRLPHIKIFASGSLDEHRIRRLLAEKAPIDGFGVGSRLDTSADAPYLDCAYKLQAYADRPRRKRSEGKATWPGVKQVLRARGADRRFTGDTVALATEAVGGEPLLQPVLQGGRRCSPAEQLVAARHRITAELQSLPRTLCSLDAAAAYPVVVSTEIRKLAAALDAADR